MLVWIPFLGIGVLVIWLAIRAYQQNQARIAALMSLCASKGWTFQPLDPYQLPRRWDGTPFDSGYDRAAENVVMGEVDGHPMVAFDYEYKEDSRDSNGNTSTTTHRYSVVALGMPCALPELHVGPEGVFSRLGNALGLDDIELESEDFNRRFRVRCPDRKLATDVLTPRTMALLLRSDRVRFRFVGSDVVSYEDGRLEPADILTRSAVLSGLLSGVPAFVWKDYGLPDPATPSPGSLT
jgi:hypothetical protein